MKLAIITCHYNWFGFQSPRANLQRFMELTSHLPVFGAEAQLPEHPFLTTGMPGWTQITASNDQVMMQKECLLNIAAANVPKEFDALAWVDADVLFDRPDWFADTASLLETYPVVQPYATARWLGRDGNAVMERPGIAREPLLLHRCQAHPGFAMAAHRDLWAPAGPGLYEHLVVGNGDVGFAAAALGHNSPGHIQMNPALWTHYQSWAAPLRKWMAGRPMGFVAGNASHLWHGDLADRRYIERNEVLLKTLNPELHLTHGANGLLSWTQAAHFGLRYAVRSHFANRKEDG
jgi:hypothetical protein